MFVRFMPLSYAEAMKKTWRCICYLLAIGLCLPIFSSQATEDLNTDDDRSDLVISAVNAGYTGDDGSTQNYDFVELYNLTGEPVILEGYELAYMNSSGNESVHAFEAGAVLNAEFLTLGYSGSPQFSEADSSYKYKFNISADAGTISLRKDGHSVDELCWGSAMCDAKFTKFSTKASDNKALVRCIVDGLIEQCSNGKYFEFLDYHPELDFRVIYFDNANIDLPEDRDTSCDGLIFSEIYSYFENDYSEQFVELYNSTDEIITLGSCKIYYKNKPYEMSGEVYPGGYHIHQNANMKLTKNPTTSNSLSLLDFDGKEIATMDYYNGQKKMTSFAFFGIDSNGAEVWLQTYAVTAGSENIFQEFKSCATGKIINPSTGNCINFLEDEALPDCPLGKYRNPETNRCKSYDTLTSILAPCADGYYRNPTTNRCKKIDTSTTELAPCAEGYERNPETNRCRKTRNNDGADYGVEPISYSDEASFVAYVALATVVAGGLLYIVFQFRYEIGKFLRHIFKKSG